MKCDFKYYQMVYPKIIETIRMIAAPPEIQITLFPENIPPPDEIIDTLEDSVRFAKILEDNNYITSEQFNSILIMFEKFHIFEKNDWTIESMYFSKKWNETRELAKISMKKFSVEYATPNLYWIKNIY